MVREQTNFILLVHFRLLDQVFTRFEEENGGMLLSATLCLLETSATGLLEIELLKILGDEDNLIPQEKDSELEKGATFSQLYCLRNVHFWATKVFIMNFIWLERCFKSQI